MKMLREYWLSFKSLGRDENGAIGITLLILFPVAIGFASLAVDAPYLFEVKNTLQVAADAAALAADQYVGSDTSTSSTPCTGAKPPSLCGYAATIAQANVPSTYGTVLTATSANIVIGYWSPSGTFANYTGATGQVANAVQVTVSYTAKTFFTAALATIAKNAGFTSMSLTATATAAFTSYDSNGTTGNGSGVGVTSDLIIVQDISGSFSSTIADAQAAELDCVKDFALTGGSTSKFGLTLFGGSSPQATVTQNSPSGGWGPQGWTASQLSGTATTNPYAALTAATANNFQTNMDSNINNAGDCQDNFGSTNVQYSCSGSNIAAGMQSAINQFCPATGCPSGTMQMIIITDGVPNCTYVQNPSKGNWGTSTIAGQNCPAGQVVNKGNGGETNAQTSAGDVQLLTDAQNLATYAGSLGITVSTIYYSGESGQGGGNTVDPNSGTGQTYAEELEDLTTLANTALKTKLGANALAGQFFNEPTGNNLTTDMQSICAGGANAGQPRLVL